MLGQLALLAMVCIVLVDRRREVALYIGRRWLSVLWASVLWASVLWAGLSLSIVCMILVCFGPMFMAVGLGL